MQKEKEKSKRDCRLRLRILRSSHARKKKQKCLYMRQIKSKAKNGCTKGVLKEKIG